MAEKPTFKALLTVLENRGWRWEQGALFGPNGSMSVAGSVTEDDWPGGINGFRERIISRLERLRSEDWGENRSNQEKAIADTVALVDALRQIGL